MERKNAPASWADEQRSNARILLWIRVAFWALVLFGVWAAWDAIASIIGNGARIPLG